MPAGGCRRFNLGVALVRCGDRDGAAAALRRARDGGEPRAARMLERLAAQQEPPAPDRA